MSRPGIIVDFHALTEAGRQITWWAQCAGWAIVIPYISDQEEESAYFFATEWLEVNGVTYDMLLVREPTAEDSAAGAKKNLLEEITDNYKIEFVLDPDPVSGLMYRMNGMKVFSEWRVE